MAKKPLTEAQNEALDHDGDHKAGGAPAGGNHAAKIAAEEAAGGPQTDQSTDATAGPASVAGGDGPDSITGGEGESTVSGDAGDGSVAGGQGDDTITGGEGNDTLVGVTGDDTVSQAGSVGVDPASNDVVAAAPVTDPNAPPAEPSAAVTDPTAAGPEPVVEPAVEGEPASQAAEPTAEQATQFPQDQIDQVAASAHDAAVEQNTLPRAEPTDAHVEALMDHIELRASEIADFVRREAQEHGRTPEAVLLLFGRRVTEILGLR